jgi:hypothetical protein
MTFTAEEKANANQKDAGPYQSEDGEEWWFPTDRWTWNLAQAEAKDFAEESECKARFEGIRTVELHDHDDWAFESDACPNGGCPHRRAYYFTWVSLW